MSYKVGDRVLIRQWHDMKADFEVHDGTGDIMIPVSNENQNGILYFTKRMKCFCGTIQKISEVSVNAYRLESDSDYLFTDNMIEKRVDMTLSDLKTGYIVTLRNGEEYVVYLNVETMFYEGLRDVLVNKNSSSWRNLPSYNEDMTIKYFNGFYEGPAYDIVKVEKPSHPYALQDLQYSKRDRILLWERDLSTKELKSVITAKTKKYLLSIGHIESDLPQIKEAISKTIYECDGKRISRKDAIEILGKEAYLSGISRSAFHRTSLQCSDNGQYVYFDSSKLFKD